MDYKSKYIKYRNMYDDLKIMLHGGNTTLIENGFRKGESVYYRRTDYSKTMMVTLQDFYIDDHDDQIYFDVETCETGRSLLINGVPHSQIMRIDDPLFIYAATNKVIAFIGLKKVLEFIDSVIKQNKSAKFISVGSGNGYIENLITGIEVICIEPNFEESLREINNFIDSDILTPPFFKYVDDLIDSSIINLDNIILFINYPPPFIYDNIEEEQKKTPYEVDAIQKLKPTDIIMIYQDEIAISDVLAQILEENSGNIVLDGITYKLMNSLTTTVGSINEATFSKEKIEYRLPQTSGYVSHYKKI